MAKRAIPTKLNKRIKEYIKTLKDDKLPITKVILYGSYARSAQNKWSDVDICIVSPKFKDSWKAGDYLWSKLNFDMEYTIEPIGFSPKDFADKYNSLANEIKNTGLEIKV